MRRGAPALVLIAVAAALLPVVTTAAVRKELTPLPRGQARYDESCGGCHGLNGVSAAQHIPVLRGVVGTFLCSDEGRRYVMRLPNVAFAGMDDATLAATLNFVVFTLGRETAPADARPFTAREVGYWRQRPLKSEPLQQRRADVLAGAAEACAARVRPEQSTPVG